MAGSGRGDFLSIAPKELLDPIPELYTRGTKAAGWKKCGPNALGERASFVVDGNAGHVLKAAPNGMGRIQRIILQIKARW